MTIVTVESYAVYRTMLAVEQAVEAEYWADHIPPIEDCVETSTHACAHCPHAANCTINVEDIND